MGFGSSSSPSTRPPRYSTKTHTPLCLQDTFPPLTPSLRPLIEIPPIPPGNQALAAPISRANTPYLQEPSSPSPSAQPSAPLAFLAEILMETSNSLQLNPELVQDLSPHALQTITAGEGSILAILCATVSGIIAITTQLDTGTTQLSEIRKENQQLLSNLHNLSCRVANESATHEDIRPLQSALHDLSYKVTTPAPTARPSATTAPTQCQPGRGHPPTST